ncbi:hypothetical protein GGF32_006608 [Allomyces javanicus]|nr:hypothetical protein GGF32_006608 [Allomyces javanicus]
MIPTLWPAHDAPVVVLARAPVSTPSSTSSNSNLPTGLATLSLDAATVPAPHFLLTTGDDGSVKLWNVDAATTTAADSAQVLISPTSNDRPPRTVTAVAQSSTRVFLALPKAESAGGEEEEDAEAWTVAQLDLAAGQTTELNEFSGVDAVDEINFVRIVLCSPDAKHLVATDDAGYVTLLDVAEKKVVASWKAHTTVCSGAVLLPHLQETKRKSDKTFETELLTFGMDYSIKSWKLVVNSSGAPKVQCLSSLDIRSILPSQQQQPTSNTAYNPPLVLAHTDAYTDRAMSARSQVHVLGLGNGSVLFLRARSRQRKSLGHAAFHVPGSAVTTAAARALGWEAVEAQGAHMYFVEQLSTVPGHPHLVVSACADGSIAAWDVRNVFDAATPCGTASVLVKVSAMAVVGVQGATVQVAVAGPLLSIDAESAPAELVQTLAQIPWPRCVVRAEVVVPDAAL